MKEMDTTDRELLLQRLRTAVCLQIELWDVASSIGETVDYELDEVLSRVLQMSITADSGMELTSSDLDAFLGLESTRGKVKCGGPLEPKVIQ